MIQRIQTVYLLLAIIALSVCLMMPLGTIQPDGMGLSAELFNLLVLTENANLKPSLWFEPFPLFLCIFIVVLLLLTAIFSYKRRMRQAKLCSIAIAFCIIWYAGLYLYAYQLAPEATHFKPSWGTCLPLVAIILIVLARKGIMADERLVRESNRLR